MLAIALPRAWGDSCTTGIIRQQPEDFQVEEIPVCEPEGAGEHLWLKVRKTGQNTDWVARQLAGRARVKLRDVGYAGLKDRHAITEQWFSVHLPGRPDPDFSDLGADMSIIESGRHSRKIRRGALKGNAFRIRLRDVRGDRVGLEARLLQIREGGFPNYFGEQRFGRDSGNLSRAEALFDGQLNRVSRSKRSLYISAARSFLFNQVLAERIRQANWNKVVQGDVMQLDGRSACFIVASPDDEVNDRSTRLEIHPTGPLWGRGPTMATEGCLALEQSCLEAYAQFRAGLENVGLKQERRALRVRAGALDWEWSGPSELVLQLQLPKGSYATSLLREMGYFETGSELTAC